MPRTTLFRHLLQQRHLTTHDAFATQYGRAAVRLAELDRDPRLASLEVSPRQFDRWYSGELLTLPRPDACRVLEHMLGRPVSELFAAAREMPASLRESPSVLPQREADENPLDIVTRTQQLTTGNADGATLAFISSSLKEIVERYEQDGPYVLRPQVRQVRRLTHTLLDGHQPPGIRRELFRLAARASGLLGYMAVNTGDFVLAEAYRAPQYVQSIRLLVNGRARALGKTGDRRTAEKVIGQALHLSDLHEIPAGLTPCIAFEPYGRARTLANAVTSHVALRNTAQVLRDAEQIDDLVEHSASAWSRSLVRLDVAAALLQQRVPEVDHAMSLGREALRLCADRPISSVYQRSRDLRAQAAPWCDRPSVRDYGEEFGIWSSQPATSAMASAAS
ncbi:hypothetical protein F3K43_26415 [Streptomyces sp. LBUM 1476]|uniref:XRE family transcriptional regulator n=1 Tax=Streptomyces acidiscabies TaxID=42234 RepID=A0AAP6BI46_9ACTN|nr:hypothetical protein [Streptomyces acidiscabies]MBP5939117.1 hypothetical protein [Streptomyces sp. LBUM 1476]MBZ3910232.1 hypothetical protein [Streptomyces acidiscabies]MDX2965174.1 hypothetical protein [Streptomyces acidiscabies]MDX3023596.1 hypothetical protein [Streptomyces acidiscabies]MDX3789674.1 hypothetical protein [Streptomyces acidiscabies]